MGRGQNGFITFLRSQNTHRLLLVENHFFILNERKAFGFYAAYEFSVGPSLSLLILVLLLITMDLADNLPDRQPSTALPASRTTSLDSDCEFPKK